MKLTHVFFAAGLFYCLYGCAPATPYAGHFSGKGTMVGAPTVNGSVDVKLDVDPWGSYKLTVTGDGRTLKEESGALKGHMLLPKGKIWMSQVKSIHEVPGGTGYTLKSANEEFKASLGPKQG